MMSVIAGAALLLLGTLSAWASVSVGDYATDKWETMGGWDRLILLMVSGSLLLSVWLLVAAGLVALA